MCHARLHVHVPWVYVGAAELANKEGGLFREMLNGQAIEGTINHSEGAANHGVSGGGDANAVEDASGDDAAAVAEEEEKEAAAAAATAAARVIDKAGGEAATSDAAIDATRAKATAAAAATTITTTSTSSSTTSSSSSSSTSRSRILRRVWGLQKPDAHLFPLGVLAAAGGGCIQPCLALVYGGAIALFVRARTAKNKRA